MVHCTEEAMANRHSHKKLRAEIRARMAKTGESYQTARQRILMRANEQHPEVDLVPFRFFGVPMTLATAEGRSVHSVAVLRATPKFSRSYPLPLAAWLLPRGVN
jgi:hypothetical protein